MIINKLRILLYLIPVIAVPSVISQGLTFEQTMEKAKEDNRKVIIDVYTDWCGWCKKMDRDVYEDKSVKKIINKNFMVFKLDAEGTGKITYNGTEYSETELALFFEAQGYPTTVFLEPDGALIEYKYKNYTYRNLPGYIKAGDFKIMLKFIGDEKYKDTDLSTVF